MVLNPTFFLFSEALQWLRYLVKSQVIKWLNSYVRCIKSCRFKRFEKFIYPRVKCWRRNQKHISMNICEINWHLLGQKGLTAINLLLQAGSHIIFPIECEKARESEKEERVNVCIIGCFRAQKVVFVSLSKGVSGNNWCTMLITYTHIHEIMQSQHMNEQKNEI